MPEKRFRTITVAAQLYQQVQEKAKKERNPWRSSSATYSSTYSMWARSSRTTSPLLDLVALETDQVIIRDNKKDKIADVRVRKAEGGKLQLYCTLDSTDYCPHTAFAAALPQVINATRR